MTDEEKTLNIEPNIGGLLCYAPCCIGLLISIGVAILEKKNRFMRFHAFQSLLLHGVGIVVFLALGIAQWIATMIFWPLGLLFTGLIMLLALGMLGLMVMLMMKAYAKEEYRLHTIAERVDKFL